MMSEVYHLSVDFFGNLIVLPRYNVRHFEFCYFSVTFWVDFYVSFIEKMIHTISNSRSSLIVPSLYVYVEELLVSVQFDATPWLWASLIFLCARAWSQSLWIDAITCKLGTHADFEWELQLIDWLWSWCDFGEPSYWTCMRYVKISRYIS